MDRANTGQIGPARDPRARGAIRAFLARAIAAKRLFAGLADRAARGATILGNSLFALGRLAARFMLDPRSGPPAAGAFAFLIVFAAIPAPVVDASSYSKALYASDGTLLGAAVSSDGQWHFPAGSSVDARFARALLEFEDRRFMLHPGFDVRAIARAFLQNLGSGEIVSGGSTLTMQAIRAARKGERTVLEKAIELWLSVRLELVEPKRRILERYMADAPFGGNVIGVEAASFRYLGRSPESMSWAEAATLAVLPNSPALIHLGRSRVALLAKRDRLLARLDAAGALPEGELEAAKFEPLPPEPFPIPRAAPQLLDRAIEYAPGGFRIVTTIDPLVQRAAARAVERAIPRLEDLGVANAACVAVRISDGAVVAYVGNVPREFAWNTGAEAALDVDCAVAGRSSGSALKPFLYACMIDSGELLPGQIVPDVPTRVGGFSPENNSGEYSGAVRADDALCKSLNVPFVRLLRSFGVDRFKRALDALGFTTLWRPSEDYGLSLILGGAEVTLLELVGAYASMARVCIAGDSAAAVFPPTWVAREAPEGRPLPFSRASAWLTLQALLGVARPAEEAAWTEFASSMLIAWKTGTSWGYRDSWSIGVNGEYAIGVWVGNADGQGRPELYGSSGAAPIMFQAFRGLPKATWFAMPVAELKAVRVCADSGFIASDDCPRTEEAIVPSTMSVRGVCPYCATWALSDDGAYRVDSASSGEYGAVPTKLFSLPPTMEWYFVRKQFGYEPLPPYAPGSETGGVPGFDLLTPEPGMSVYVPIELDGSPGAVVFEAVCPDADATLYWHLDDRYLGATRGIHQMAARPTLGEHILTVLDDSGAAVSRAFFVLNER
jgi:penicillin-binding protein 1C